MRGDVEPAALARVLDHAERPRAWGWSLRSALTRYAQREPERVSRLLEVVRRLEFALHPNLRAVADHGPQLWAVLQDGEGSDHIHSTGVDLDDTVLGLLRCSIELDRLGDVLAEWAGDPIAMPGPGPGADVDATTVEVAGRLDRLGIPREERRRPPARVGRG